MEKSREEVLKAVMLNGYVTERNVEKTLCGVQYEMTTYQGEHCDEYLVRNVKSGQCELFYKGILQLSWKEKDGKRIGEFVVYEKGKALRRETLAGMLGRERRYIENCKNGLGLVIEGNGVLYRGEYDNVDSLKREGRGVEYDMKSGRVLRCGMWKNDELFQILQEFESEEVMIEYEVMIGEENVSVLNRHPVYEGGYVFDEEKGVGVRNGDGYVIDVNTGIAVREGKWERGVEKESEELFNGWYVKCEGNDVFNWGIHRRVTIHELNEWKDVDKRVTELVIASNGCNETEFTQFDVSELTELKSIEIGDDCFENVKEVKLVGLKKLERVVIGKNSFTKKKGYYGNDPNRHFYLRDCERMRELKMDRYSFSDYTVCEIANVNSLEVIEMGDLSGKSDNFFSAPLELKNLPQLKSLLFGYQAFCGCVNALFENLPELTSIRLGAHAFAFKWDNESCELTMQNLPKLTTLTTTCGDSESFYYPRHLILEDMPSLQTVSLPHAFDKIKKDDVKPKNIGALARFFHYSCLFVINRKEQSHSSPIHNPFHCSS